MGLLLVGLFFLAAVAVELYMVHNLLKSREAVNWPIAKGIILKSELKSNGGLNTTYEARIEYKYQAAGQTYQSSKVRARGTSSRSQSEVAPFVAQLPAGIEVAVYYNPSNPADALLMVGADETDYLVAVIPNIFIVFLAVILVVVFRLWWRAIRGVDVTQQEDYSQEPVGYRTWGPRVRIHCPLCKKETEARTYRLVEQDAFRHVATLVECLPCGVIQNTHLPLEGLGQYSADELTSHLYYRVSFLTKFLAIVSVAFCWFPYVGLVLSGLGFLASYHLSGWTKRYSLIGLVLSSVLSLVYTCLWIFVK
jgi:hypothetical protein